MSDHFIFGYGSLVNRHTHSYAQSHPARLKGWRRVWRHTTLRDVAFLNVVEDASCEIDGLILEVPRHAPELDQREYAYTRTHVTPSVTHGVEQAVEINLFAISAGTEGPPQPEHAILMSYLDTVVSGYFAEFGEAGVRDFFDTTAGWDAPILNDRAAPRYPRHSLAGPEIMQMVDAALRGLPSVVIEA